MKDAPESILPVAPFAAPAQGHYNESAVGSGRGKDGKKCSGAPFGCPYLANDCSGMNGKWRFCRLVLREDPLVTVPPNLTDEGATKMIKRHHLDQKNLKRIADRAVKAVARKAAKEAAKAAKEAAKEAATASTTK